MVIQIDKKFYAKQTESEFTLIEKVNRETTEIIKGKKVKTGEKRENEQVIGYYTSLESVINKVIKVKLARKNKIVNLKEFLQEYKKEKQSLMDFLQL